MKIFKSLKRKWIAYLERLAKSNEETYGSGRLNCCGLNSNEQKRGE